MDKNFVKLALDTHACCATCLELLHLLDIGNVSEEYFASHVKEKLIDLDESISGYMED